MQKSRQSKAQPTHSDCGELIESGNTLNRVGNECAI